jgi:diketogulonate reductase-like aldo/keto reductase
MQGSDQLLHQLALAWLVQKTGVVAIPKSSDLRRLEQNFAASKIVLSAEILEMLDRLYEPPKRKQSLAMV